jgi:hypothetical protein
MDGGPRGRNDGRHGGGGLPLGGGGMMGGGGPSILGGPMMGGGGGGMGGGSSHALAALASLASSQIRCETRTVNSVTIIGLDSLEGFGSGFAWFQAFLYLDPVARE